MDVQANLMRALEDILDKMAFLYFDDPEEEPAPDAYEVVTQIQFSGAISGALNLFFTRESAEELARNLVGIRDEDELFDGTVDDAVREFTNMVMGRTLTTLDPEHRFEMDVPAIVAAPSPPPPGTVPIEVVGMLDEEPCKVVIHYQERTG